MFKRPGYKENRILLIAILNTTVLSIGHAYTISTALFASFMIFLSLTLLSPKELFLPIMLFYLPWSPVMKLSPDSFTIYTMILPIFFLSLFIGSEANETIKETIMITGTSILFSAVIAMITLGVKLMFSYPLALDYLIFLMMLIMMPTYIKHYIDKISFMTCIIFLISGTISACIAAEILMNDPHMLRYIDVYVWEQVGLIRTSGFYGDANFYSVHILVSIAGLLILSVSQNGRYFIFSLIGIMTLFFFGSKSVSKMFLLSFVLILILWYAAILLLRRNAVKKMGIFVCILLAVLFIFSSDLFSDEIHYYLFRFGSIDNATSFTTGRSDLWLNYLSYLTDNLFILMFGVGYTKVLPDFGAGSHSTIIQILYQFGLVGTFFMIRWFAEFRYAAGLNERTDKTVSQILFIVVLVIACFVPWLALDMLFFDEFFYITALFFVGFRYITIKNPLMRAEERK